jgi:hypothetical protein
MLISFVAFRTKVKKMLTGNLPAIRQETQSFAKHKLLICNTLNFVALAKILNFPSPNDPTQTSFKIPV